MYGVYWYDQCMFFLHFCYIYVVQNQLYVIFFVALSNNDTKIEKQPLAQDSSLQWKKRPNIGKQDSSLQPNNRLLIGKQDSSLQSNDRPIIGMQFYLCAVETLGL